MLVDAVKTSNSGVRSCENDPSCVRQNGEVDSKIFLKKSVAKIFYMKI